MKTYSHFCRCLEFNFKNWASYQIINFSDIKKTNIYFHEYFTAYLLMFWLCPFQKTRMQEFGMLLYSPETDEWISRLLKEFCLYLFLNSQIRYPFFTANFPRLWIFLHYLPY